MGDEPLTLEEVIEELWAHDAEFGEHVPQLRAELAALRAAAASNALRDAKAAAWERIYNRCRLYNREFPHGTDAATLVMHLGRFARDEVYQFQEEHNGR